MTGDRFVLLMTIMLCLLKSSVVVALFEIKRPSNHCQVLLLLVPVEANVLICNIEGRGSASTLTEPIKTTDFIDQIFDLLVKINIEMLKMFKRYKKWL